MQRAKDYRCSSSGNLKIQDVFKGVKRVPCRYRAQQTSWMSSELFEEWVTELDRNFGSKKRKITLIIDNCPAHPDVPALEWVELIFLPPNTTSVTQPMDQGVTRGLKAKYRSLPVKKQITALEKGIERALIDDDDDTFASLDVKEDVMEDLKNDLEVMKEKFNMNFELTAEELVDIDFEISVTGTVSDADIITEVTRRAHDADDEENSDNEEQPTECLTKPSFNDVMNSITILEDYSLLSNFDDDLMKAPKEVNRAIDLDRLSNKKQSNIEDFFSC